MGIHYSKPGKMVLRLGSQQWREGGRSSELLFTEPLEVLRALPNSDTF